MLNQIEHWRQSQRTPVVLAAMSSLFFALLFWLWEREMLWMLVVLLPPIWSPMIYRYFDPDRNRRLDTRATAFLVVGLVLLFGLGTLIYLS